MDQLASGAGLGDHTAAGNHAAFDLAVVLETGASGSDADPFGAPPAAVAIPLRRQTSWSTSSPCGARGAPADAVSSTTRSAGGGSGSFGKGGVGGAATAALRAAGLGPQLSGAVGLLVELRAALRCVADEPSDSAAAAATAAAAAAAAPATGSSSSSSSATAAAAAAALLARTDLWQSPALTGKLKAVLKSVPCVTGAVPGWVRALPAAAPFLWPAGDRENMVRIMAMGLSWGITALQEHLHPVEKERSEIQRLYMTMEHADFERAMRIEQRVNDVVHQSHATSKIASNNVDDLASRGWLLLSQAEAVFGDRPFLSSGILELKFRGEHGFGSGVHASFYVRCAHELSTRATALSLPRLDVQPPCSISAAAAEAAYSGADFDRLEECALATAAVAATSAAEEEGSATAAASATLVARPSNHPLLGRPGQLRPRATPPHLAAVLAAHALAVESGRVAMVGRAGGAAVFPRLVPQPQRGPATAATLAAARATVAELEAAPKQYVMTLGSGISGHNIRREPSVHSTSLGTVANGDRVFATAEGAEWLKLAPASMGPYGGASQAAYSKIISVGANGWKVVPDSARDAALVAARAELASGAPSAPAVTALALTTPAALWSTSREGSVVGVALGSPAAAAGVSTASVAAAIDGAGGDAAAPDDADADAGLEFPLGAALVPVPFRGTFRVMRAAADGPNGTTQLEYRAASGGGGGGGDPACRVLLALADRPGGAAGLELWPAGVSGATAVAAARTEGTCKVTVRSAVAEGSSGGDSVTLEVAGPLPCAWGRTVGYGAPAPSQRGGDALHGSCWNAPLWVLDDLASSAPAHVPAARSSDGSTVGSGELGRLAGAALGLLACPNGLFPAPLVAGADGRFVLGRFRFIGRLLGKAFADGFKVRRCATRARFSGLGYLKSCIGN